GERRVASGGVLTATGGGGAQPVVLPLHIGASPACTGAVIAAFRDGIAEGDAFIINHPYHGGSPHAPDIAVITPVFVAGALFGFCGSTAPKSDIGGPAPRRSPGPTPGGCNPGIAPPAAGLPSRA